MSELMVLMARVDEATAGGTAQGAADARLAEFRRRLAVLCSTYRLELFAGDNERIALLYTDGTGFAGWLGGEDDDA